MSLPDRQTSPRTNTILLSMLNYLHTRYTVITAVMLRTVYLSNAVTWFMYFFFSFCGFCLSLARYFIYHRIIIIFFPWHPPSLIRVIRPVWSVFAVRKKKTWALSYPLSAQRKLWSDWANAQVDLSLRICLCWSFFAGRTRHFVGLVMRRLMCRFGCGSACSSNQFFIRFSLFYFYFFIFFFENNYISNIENDLQRVTYIFNIENDLQSFTSTSVLIVLQDFLVLRQLTIIKYEGHPISNFSELICSFFYTRYFLKPFAHKT